MKNLKMKTIVAALLGALLSAFASPCFSQTGNSTLYPAWLISKKGTEIKRADVLIAPENGILKISGTKDCTISKSLPYATLKTADYTYSEKPQIGQAVVAGVLVGYGVLLAVNKTKRHWLVLETGSESVLLELKKENYRRLLFEMSAGGLKLTDSGDRREEPKITVDPSAPPANFVEDEPQIRLFN